MVTYCPRPLCGSLEKVDLDVVFWTRGFWSRYVCVAGHSRWEHGPGVKALLREIEPPTARVCQWCGQPPLLSSRRPKFHEACYPEAVKHARSERYERDKMAVSA